MQFTAMFRVRVSSQKSKKNKVKQASLTGSPTTSGKPHFSPDLDLIGPNFDHKIYFGGFNSTRC